MKALIVAPPDDRRAILQRVLGSASLGSTVVERPAAALELLDAKPVLITDARLLLNPASVRPAESPFVLAVVLDTLTPDDGAVDPAQPFAAAMQLVPMLGLRSMAVVVANSGGQPISFSLAFGDQPAFEYVPDRKVMEPSFTRAVAAALDKAKRFKLVT